MPSAPEDRTAPHALAAQLRAEVLAGRLALGTPLREEEIAARTGHSRHTVRAALARLVTERLAVAAPYRGVRVTAFSDDDVRALQQLRTALESEAVRLLRLAHGDRWPDSVLDPVRAAVADLARQRDDDWPAVAAAHARVHRRLVAAAASPRIAEAHDRLDAELLLVLVHVRPTYSVAGLVEEHAAYVEQVQLEGGGAVCRHLDHSTGLILEARRIGDLSR